MRRDNRIRLQEMKAEPSTLPSVANGATKHNFSTRVATGKARHVPRIDERGMWARRDRELHAAIVSDLGGMDRLSELERQLVRRAVGLALQCEQIEAGLAIGEKPDPSGTATLINAFNRCAKLLGWNRRARDVTPDLESYLSERYSREPDEAEA
jgi:hypothetical protein